MAKYIDKSDVIKEINRVLNSYDPNEITSGRYALIDLRDFINSMKVKEVVAEQEGICNGMFNRIIGDTWNLVIPLDKVGLKHGDKVKIFITKEE